MTEEIKAVDEQEEKVEELIEEVEKEIEEEVPSLPQSVMVGDKEYFLFKKGVGQAKQVSDLLNWLGAYGEKLVGVFSNESGGDITVESLGSPWAIITSIGSIVSEAALIDLFIVVTGCSKKEANEHFSINTLIDGVQVLFSQEEYAKVLNRFF